MNKRQPELIDQIMDAMKSQYPLVTTEKNKDPNENEENTNQKKPVNQKKINQFFTKTKKTENDEHKDKTTEEHFENNRMLLQGR